MPRHSPFAIVLSKAERHALESRARQYTLPYFQVIRARMILLAARDSAMIRSPRPSPSDAMSSVSGANGSSINAWPGWRSVPARAAPELFPPEVVVQVKAIACELPATLGVPLSRLSTADVRREVQRQGIAATLSDKTVWRWLHEDAIRPWQHRTGIFPRDPEFAAKAGRILNLYARSWNGRPLASDEFVLSADEKTSIQARRRRHRSLPPRAHQPMRVEHEYTRCGAWAYLAALDVHHATLFGRCERSTGIAPFDRLVTQVMTQAPYREARHVYWIVDNGSSHRGGRAAQRLQAQFPNLILVHSPIHASWLNQIEIYFSIVQREALTPNDFQSLADVEARLLGFQRYYEQIATPVEWRFTKDDLAALLRKLGDTPALAAVA